MSFVDNRIEEAATTRAAIAMGRIAPIPDGA